MTQEEIKSKVIEYRKWYQRMNLDGVITNPGFEGGGDFVWEKMKYFLPSSMEGMRVLDIGCSAGYYTIQSAILGAEAIGVEILERDYKESLFVKKFFEEKYGPLKVSFINKDISDLNLDSLGKFDYIYLMAVLYHLGKHKYGKFTPKAFEEQDNLISKFCSMTDNIIARTTNRVNRTTEFFTPIFEKNGFKLNEVIDEGNRQIIHFKRS